jgi:hypothetical protein
MLISGSPQPEHSPRQSRWHPIPVQPILVQTVLTRRPSVVKVKGVSLVRSVPLVRFRWWQSILVSEKLHQTIDLSASTFLGTMADWRTEVSNVSMSP